MSKRKVLAEDINGATDASNHTVEHPAKLLKADTEPHQGNCDLNGDEEREEEEDEDKIDKFRTGKRVRSRILKKKAESAKLRFCPIDDPIIETVGSKLKNSKRRRTWELWSIDDKTIFFDALREYGKDFDNIQNYFQQKITKKNLPAHYIKNKEQIRHFYYRSWHKIKGYINFTGDLKKSTKEIYGLVNYGELWKKVGSTLDEKYGARLNELVRKGGVSIKINGKNVRIKTPICRALKRINQKHESSSVHSKLQSKLPEKIWVELRPRETGDWYRVQNVAQNPYVRVSLGLGRRISSLVKCLNVKWRHSEEKLRESFMLELGKTAPPIEESKDQLILLPPKDAKIKIPVIEGLPPLTSASISLLSYKKKKSGDAEKGKRLKIRIRKEGSGDEASHNIVDFDNGEVQIGEDELVEDIDGPPLEDIEMAEDIIAGEADFLMEESDQEASRSPPLPGDVSDPDSDAEPLDEIKNGNIDDIEDDELEDDEVPKEEDIIDELPKDEIKDEDIKEEVLLEPQDISSGWSESSASNLTVGMVYMMLGCEGLSVLKLDYHWRPSEIKLESSSDSTNKIANDTNNKVTNDIISKVAADCGIKVDIPLNETCTKSANSSKPINPCGNLMARLVKLAAATTSLKQGKERKSSLSASSPSVRFVSPGAGSRSPVSRPSPGSRGTVAKQLPLPQAGAERAGSPLAVPLDQGREEPEFRMPAAPVGRQGAIRDAAFREQIGQLLPKFTNRRGRTNRSRARQTHVVGRQLLQPNIAPMPESVTVQVIRPMAVNGHLVNLPRQHILVPAPVIVARDNEPSSSIQMPNVTSTNQPPSPPQIHIPSPAPSPAHRRTPSPTPSLSSFLDCFPSTPNPPTTPNKNDQFLAMYEGDSSLLQTPPRPAATPPTSPSRCLADSNDVSLGAWSLGSLSFESPIKQISGQIPPSEDSQNSVISNSSEVERMVNTMMNENSVDFTATFRQLVKQCNSSDE